MATKGIYKLDDGNSYPTNCFPARSLLRPRYEEGAGHWQVARQTAEKTKMELLFGTRSSQVKWKSQAALSGAHGHLDEKTLSGIYLMKLHHVKSPSHLCSVDISNRNFVSAKEDDFEQFDSVAYINATENLLTLEVFRKFPGLRELELSLNGLRNLKVNTGDFPYLEILDLSYNNLSPEDVRALGVLPHLKVLHLTANGLSSLPLDLAVPESNSESFPRFPALEVLLLDDNHLSHPNVFVSLANLRSLKQLNLDKNGIKEVPYLHHMDSSRFSIHPLSAKSGIREGLRSRKSAGKRLHQDRSPEPGGQAEYIIVQNSKDPDRTEIVFPSWSPDLPTEENSPSPSVAAKTTCASPSPEFILPLPELRFLNLANNQIEQEEDLLAVALFPSLAELTFYGNPFTTSRSGDPPLLTSFLQNKLGIKMVRKKISKLEKPRIFIPIKANRKVKTQLPKVRKPPAMLEAPPETTFWQLWTGADLDPNKRMSLADSEPLPPIRSYSIGYDPEQPVISTLQEEEMSAPVSLVSSASEENDLPVESSLEQLVFGSIPSGQSSLDKILSTSLSPCRSISEEQDHLESPGTTEPPSEQDLSEPLPPRENPFTPYAPTKSPSSEQDLSERVSLPSLPLAGQNQPDPVPPPNLPSQKRVLAPGPPMAEQDLSKTHPPVSLVAKEDLSQPVTPPNSPVLEQSTLEELVPPTEPSAEEQDMGQSLQPVRSLWVEEVPSEAFPPARSPTVEEQREPIPPASSISHGQGLPELASPTGLPVGDVPETLSLATSPAEEQEQVQLSSPSTSTSQVEGLSKTISSYPSGTLLLITFVPEGQKVALSHSSTSQELDLSEPTPPSMSYREEQDLSEPLLPTRSLPADQDHLEPVPLPTSSLQEQNLSGFVPSTGSLEGEQDLDESLLPSASGPTRSPPAEQERSEPIPLTSTTFQDPNLPESEPSATPEPSPSTNSPLLSPTLTDAFPLSEPSLAQKVCSVLLPPSRSTSRELYQLFAQTHSAAAPYGLYGEFSSEDDLFHTTEEFVEEEEKPESFFMTQVDEASSSREESPVKQPRKEKKRECYGVPEKYQGYELLLGGDPGSDFIEPQGIQQNVKALEKALRYHRVYRDSKARLDSFQKPYVPTQKKVLRVPAPTAQKTKAERLEEILLKMREPTNIVQVPLVCVLRRKKDNWREYREALALMKEFRKNYKATVATCNMASESKTMRKKCVDAGEMLRSLPGEKVSEQQLKEFPSPVTQEDEGLFSILPEKDFPSTLEH